MPVSYGLPASSYMMPSTAATMIGGFSLPASTYTTPYSLPSYTMPSTFPALPSYAPGVIGSWPASYPSALIDPSTYGLTTYLAPSSGYFGTPFFPLATAAPVPGPKVKVLYICTHNRCRSILSEAITNHFGGDKVEAKSAGSAPVGEVHPLSLKYLAEAGIPIEGLKSESWHDFEDWKPDVVVTVCDNAAGETCPVWFGKAVRIHWALVDPSKLEGTDEEKADAFRKTIEEIKGRVAEIVKVASSAATAQAAASGLASIVETLGAKVVNVPEEYSRAN